MKGSVSSLNFEGIPAFKRDDPKLGSLINQGDEGDLVLLGFPFDEGVRRNGGRVGTAEGPQSLRKFLSRVGPLYNPELLIDLSTLKISDFGDIQADSFDESHRNLRETTARLLALSKTCIVIGGGKDQSWSNGLAFFQLCESQHKTPVIINIDSHLDVRNVDDSGNVHSGCAFRLLLNDALYHSLSGSFVQFAGQGSQSALAHVNFIKANNGSLVWMRDIRSSKFDPNGEKTGTLTQAGGIFKRILQELHENCMIFVSFEIDAIAARDCPGVSCPSVDGGLSSDEAMELMRVAGEDNRVCLLDLSEYNPKIEEYLTGRLLGNLVYYFAMGFSLRSR